MPSYIEEIRLRRVEEGIVISYTHAFEDKFDSVTYLVGQVDKEDMENSYEGALRHFFDESEVWNE